MSIFKQFFDLFDQKRETHINWNLYRLYPSFYPYILYPSYPILYPLLYPKSYFPSLYPSLYPSSAKPEKPKVEVKPFSINTEFYKPFYFGLYFGYDTWIYPEFYSGFLGSDEE